MYVDPKLFDAEAIPDEVRETNALILERLETVVDPWSAHPSIAREARKTGKGAFPLAPRSERAVWEEIDGPGGKVAVRIIAPDAPDGVYLHFHGGGWVIGGAEEQDPRLERIVDNCNLAVVSVEYRLAPENPYPAAPDDCEVVALWLVENAEAKFGTNRLVIGGESAGAHLATLTMLRLRDKHDLTPFIAANLTAGVYDLGLTPSARNWGPELLVLNTRDMENYVRCFLSRDEDTRDPTVSPLFANLSGLPPALFTIGTLDPLLDDTLFMAQRWQAAGNEAELAVYPGGAHVFIAFPGNQAKQALDRIEDFLRSH